MMNAHAPSHAPLPLRSIDAEVPLEGAHSFGKIVFHIPLLILALSLMGASVWISLVLLLVGLGVGTWACILWRNAIKRQESSYQEKIKALPLSTVMHLSTSKELDKRSRALLVAFLNTFSSGWSMKRTDSTSESYERK